jgi:hypothetical protein
VNHIEGPIIERWNGSTWSLSPSPNPNANAAALNGVSCPSSTSCVAVGIANSRTLIEQWDGATWTIAASPNRTGSDFDIMYGVSCTTATACFSVGWAHVPLYAYTLIERYS